MNAVETPSRAGSVPHESPGVSTRRRLVIAWLELAVLWTFAIALPLFQLLDDSPDFLVAQDNGWPDLPIVSVGLVVVPPAMMVAAEALLGRRPAAAKLLHRAFLGLLVAALVLQVLKTQFDPNRRSLYLAAFAAGGAFAYLYGKGRFLPSVLVVLAPVPLGVLVWFLGFSSASDLSWPTSADAGGRRVEARTPVVLIVFDELSTASIMRRKAVQPRLPAFRRLAASATWFPNATTVADNTTRAVPAILTGRLPPEGRLAIPSQQPPSVFERVAGPMHVDEPITRLCQDHCDDGSWLSHARTLIDSMVTLTKRRLRRGDPPNEVGLPTDALDERPADVEAFKKGMLDGLNVLHIELPHNPYQYAPDGRRYSESIATPGLTGELWTKDATIVRQGEGRYLAQLAYTDRLLGGLMAELRRKGLWDRALVIVTADHGVSFVPGESRRDVRTQTFGEIAGVPLFVKAPRQSRGRVSPAAVQTIDVLPTIGEVLRADWRLPGQSLLRPRSRPKPTVSAQFGEPVTMPLAYFEVLRDRAARRLAAASPQTGEG